MNNKIILQQLEKKYKHIDFDKTFISIPGVCKTITLSKYIKKYYHGTDFKNFKNLRIYSHGMGEGVRKYFSNILARKKFNMPTIFLGWNGFSMNNAKEAGKELSFLLNNELKVNKEVKLKLVSCSMGNVVSGQILSNLLENDAIKADNVIMSLYRVADTGRVCSKITKVKPEDIFADIKREDLEKIKIITPNMQAKFDFIHSTKAVETLYNNISSRVDGKKLTFQDIIKLQRKQNEVGIVSAIKTF